MPLDLAKHTPGAPLSAAEIRQRRDAARTRWGFRAGLAGGVAGAAIGGYQQILATPSITRSALASADQAVIARSNQRGAAIIEAIKARIRSVGTDKNAGVYDFQIAELNRRILRAKTPAEIAGFQRSITQLQAFKAKRPMPAGRRGAVRYRDSEEAQRAVRLIDAQIVIARQTRQPATEIARLQGVRTQAAAALDALMNGAPVRAHVESRFHRGETGPQLDRRATNVKAYLRGRQRTLLATLEENTTRLRASTSDTVLADIERALKARVLRGAGKGALIGAGIGLTAAGIGILAHHIAHAGEPKGKTPIAGAALAKAASPDSPEGQIGKGLAETFRQWIDRLLGINQQSMHLADGFAQAMGPGIVQAFAAGAQNPPIDPASDPRAHIDVNFDLINPSVRQHMADYALDRIVQISTAQREAIRSAIMQQSVLQGINPNEVARTIKEAIGLTTYQRTVVESFRVGLQQLDPRVLDRKLRDGRYDKTLRRAIDTNTPLTGDQINAMVDAYHRRMVALRARTIARTEALRATSFGGVARAQQVLDDHPELDVIKGWLATDDERTRCTHRDLNGKEVEGMETPFITSAGNSIRWPLDVNAVAKEVINCRCTPVFKFVPKRGQLMAVAA